MNIDPRAACLVGRSETGEHSSICSAHFRASDNASPAVRLRRQNRVHTPRASARAVRSKGCPRPAAGRSRVESIELLQPAPPSRRGPGKGEECVLRRDDRIVCQSPIRKPPPRATSLTAAITGLSRSVRVESPANPPGVRSRHSRSSSRSGSQWSAFVTPRRLLVTIVRRPRFDPAEPVSGHWLPPLPSSSRGTEPTPPASFQAIVTRTFPNASPSITCLARLRERVTRPEMGFEPSLIEPAKKFD